MLTLVQFGAGVLLGARDGALVGAITWVVYSLLNPYGPVHPLVTLAQVSGGILTALGGAGFAALGFPNARPLLRSALLAIFGLLLTLCFDLITNVATGIVFGQMRATLLGGIPFALIHVGTNVALFAVLGVPFVAVLGRYRSRLS